MHKRLAPPILRSSSAASVTDKLNLLDILAATPLQSAANLALLSHGAATKMWKNIWWLKRNGLITSHLQSIYGAQDREVFVLSAAGLTYTSTSQEVGECQPALTTLRNLSSAQRKLRQQYCRQVLRIALRFPYYMQQEEFSHWLAAIFQEQFSRESLRPFEKSQESLWSYISASPWLWLRDVSAAYDYHGRLLTCKIDALVITTYTHARPVETSLRGTSSQQNRWVIGETSEDGLHKQQLATALLWIYVDDGISSEEIVRRRLNQVLRYRYEHGIAPMMFPPILIRASSRERAWVWAHAAQQCAQRLAMEPLRGLLLFPNEVGQRTRPEEGTSTPCNEPDWPLISDGLAHHQDSGVMTVRDLSWRLPFRHIDSRSARRHLASKLFCRCDRGVVQTIAASVTSPDEVFVSLRATPYGWLNGSDRRAPCSAPGLALPVSPQERTIWHPAGLGETVRDIAAIGNDWAGLSHLRQRQLLASLIVGLDRCHLLLLTLVANHPFMSVEDLATLAQLSGASLLNHIELLREAHLLERMVVLAPSTGFPAAGWQSSSHTNDAVRPPVTYGAVQCLQAQALGLELLSTLYGHRARQLGFREPWSGHPTSHDPGVRRFLGLLVEQIRERYTGDIYCSGEENKSNTKIELIWWRNAPAISLRYPVEGELASIAPDAAGTVQLVFYRNCPQNQQIDASARLGSSLRRRFWLEWDTGSENARDLWDKLAAYQCYTQFRRWSALEQGTPVLLIVTPEDRQERRVLRIVSELQARGTKQPGGTAGVSHMRTRSQQTLGMLTVNNTSWWTLHDNLSVTHSERATQQSVQTPRRPPLYRQQLILSLQVYVTTTYRLGLYGPLGACWTACSL